MSSDERDRGVAEVCAFPPRVPRSCRLEESDDEVVDVGAAGAAARVLRRAGGDGGIVKVVSTSAE
jgi:hypothetical protein